MIESLEDLAQEPSRDFHIGIEDQEPGASRDSPAGIDAGGEARHCAGRATSRRPGQGADERLGDRSPRGIVDDHDLTLARRNSGSAASDAVSRSTSGQLSWLTMMTVNRGRRLSDGSRMMGCRRLVHAVDLKSAAGLVGSSLIFGITQI